MENRSSEIIPNQETEPEIILCPEEVEKIYRVTKPTKDDSGRRKRLRTPVIEDDFDQGRLDENKPTIKILMYQLHPDFFNQKTNGLIYSKINTNKDGVCWDIEGKSSGHFLALILASGLAIVSTLRGVANSGPSKNRDSYNVLAEK